MWRTIKTCLDLSAVRPNVMAILRERIDTIVDFYNTKRPHTALRGATPDEIYRGEASRAHSATRAPRGRTGEPGPRVPFVIRFAFPHDQKLPYLARAA